MPRNEHFVVPVGYQYGHQPNEPDPIWKLIRATRTERGLTVQDVADMAGVASSTISRAERGYHVWLDKTRVVARALGIMIVAVPPPAPKENIKYPPPAPKENIE